ncbi:Odorant receptor 96 [Blattella germanica]|nr:Odorant receptor 96 [Blattella germanica]
MTGSALSEKRFGVQFRLLRACGIPLFMKNPSIFFKLYSYLVVVCMTSLSITVLIGTVTNSDTLKRFMQNARIFFGIFGVTVAFMFNRFFLDKVEYLINLTEQFTWEDLPKTESFRMTSWIPRVQTAGKYTFIVIFIFHYVQSAVRVLTLEELVFDIWFPFDTSKSPTFEIIVFFQFIASLTVVAIFAGYLPLNCALMAVACSQLEKLAVDLIELKQDHDFMLQLQNWIRCHQQALGYVKAMEDSLSMYMGVQFIPLFLGPCIFAFSAITSWGDFTDQTQAFVAFTAFIGQACVLCWFGAQLTEAAENVKRAAWGCDWIGTPIPVQKTILFIIARGNTDVTITAGKFVPLSNVTLMHMINNCLSMFMFLLNVKDRKEIA